MRATLNIPDELIAEAQKISGQKSKTKAVTTALREFIKNNKLDKLVALKGKLNLDYDWEDEEKRELSAQRKRGRLLEK
jgi:Arc/MetJ family transcription regulator